MKFSKAMKQGTAPLLLLFLMLSQTGCFQADRELTTLRNQVFDDIEFTYEVETEFGIGSFWFAIANNILQRVDDPEVAEISTFLKDVDGFQLGVYKLDSNSTYSQDISQNMRELVVDLQDAGYESIVRNYDSNESALIMIREDEVRKEQINSVIFLVMDTQELVLTQLKGDVNSIIETAIRHREVPEFQEVIN